MTIIEAYGALFDRNFALPWIGHWVGLGFIEDFFAVAVLAGLATFTVLRIKQAPERLERKSRFYGSHTGPAWQILGMIFLVILTLLLYRGRPGQHRRLPVRTQPVGLRVLDRRPSCWPRSAPPPTT